MFWHAQLEFDGAWDHARYTKDQEMMDRAKTNRSQCVIKHPNFHNFNTVTAQAETYLRLEKQQWGNVVITTHQMVA